MHVCLVKDSNHLQIVLEAAYLKLSRHSGFLFTMQIESEYRRAIALMSMLLELFL